MHSGRQAGMGGLGFTPAFAPRNARRGRNLNRLTVAVATVFGINTVLLLHLPSNRSRASTNSATSARCDRF